MSRISFPNWLEEVRRVWKELHRAHPFPDLDEDKAYAAWRNGVASNYYVADLFSSVQSNAVAFNSNSISQNFSSPSRQKTNLVPTMWTLTAVVIFFGMCAAILYAQKDWGGLEFMGYFALGLDALACILALICLGNDETRGAGLIKLGWEVVAGITVYCLLIGINNERQHLYKDAFAQGTEEGFTEGYAGGVVRGADTGFDRGYSGGRSRGYEEGYVDGFNEGAAQQLAQDRATLRGGFGY